MRVIQKVMAKTFNVQAPVSVKHLKNTFEVKNLKKNQLFLKWK
ncbi:hypothetical protein [Methanobrevibacter curvatus]|nr:hypothetical protein [Methanobrevibacter curvatus]